jgi:uridylate kinase
LTYTQVSQEGLGVMDETAFTLCKENNIPILVFNLQPGNVIKAVFGESCIGTSIEDI